MNDVDHFFPFVLEQRLRTDLNINGVWNLVLACKDCNRGENGKFERVPDLQYLERLNKRNEFLIGSPHPLRETSINQTGRTEQDRHRFLQQIYRLAKTNLLINWETVSKGPEMF